MYKGILVREQVLDKRSTFIPKGKKIPVQFSDLPRRGESFVLGRRDRFESIITSTVQSWAMHNEDGSMIIKTLNSVYLFYPDKEEKK